VCFYPSFVKKGQDSDSLRDLIGLQNEMGGQRTDMGAGKHYIGLVGRRTGSIDTAERVDQPCIHSPSTLSAGQHYTGPLATRRGLTLSDLRSGYYFEYWH